MEGRDDSRNSSNNLDDSKQQLEDEAVIRKPREVVCLGPGARMGIRRAAKGCQGHKMPAYLEARHDFR